MSGCAHFKVFPCDVLRYLLLYIESAEIIAMSRTDTFFRRFVRENENTLLVTQVKLEKAKSSLVFFQPLAATKEVDSFKLRSNVSVVSSLQKPFVSKLCHRSSIPILNKNLCNTSFWKFWDVKWTSKLCIQCGCHSFRRCPTTHENGDNFTIETKNTVLDVGGECSDNFPWPPVYSINSCFL